MSRPIATIVDPERCRGCGSCVAVCPRSSLSLVDGRARVTGDESLQCGHCAAVCPRGAIRVAGLIDEAPGLVARAGRPPGAVAPVDLAQLMRMRRSCRRFQERPVERGLLEDLVRLGASAPSGTNSQPWTFGLLPDRQAVVALAEAVADFFRLVDRLASQPLARLASRVLPGDPLGTFYREYHRSVREALDDWELRGRDRLFHGAPAAIVIATRPGASCPGEDALLAAGQILLAAESLGLGTCLVGFAVEAVRRDPRVRRRLGLPADERVRAIIAVGHPAVRYQRPAGRLPLVIRDLPG